MQMKIRIGMYGTEETASELRLLMLKRYATRSKIKVNKDISLYVQDEA